MDRFAPPPSADDPARPGAAPLGAAPGGASGGALLHGAEPELAGARLSVVGEPGHERLSWSRDGAEILPAAGTGIAASIADLVMGADPGRPANGGRERGIPVDQTHTSVIVDERLVVKIVVAPGAADRSAAILERLREAGSTAAPRFLGAAEWERPEAGPGPTVIALVSEYVPDSDDGWTWAVDDTVAHLRDGAAAPEWPRRLGALAAGMHAALREDPETPDPRGDDRSRATTALERTFGLLAAAEDPAAPRPRGLVRRMRARRAALAAAIDTIPGESAAPLVTPHGDFHVGQILRTGGGRYLVLDFDGDPQWGAEQRFRADGAARDVAHMLVSIDLVAAVVQRRLGGPDERAWAWALEARRRFLEAYRAAAEPGLLDEAALPGLMAEQLLIELSYAERFLAEWRYAPDGVITRRYPGNAGNVPEHTAENPDETEPPWNPPASPKT